MAIDSAKQGKLISAVKDIFLAAIGATVFIFGLIHSVPLTTQAVEYVGVYGAYFGIHVYSSASANKAGTSTTNVAAKQNP